MSVIDFTLPDQSGTPIRLGDVLPGGPAVLVVYRGDW
jgi:peroxiredoxin